MIVTTYKMEELPAFFDMLTRKGLLNKATAQARKIAAVQVVDILEPEEKQNLSSIDIDSAFERFANLNGSRFTADSLKTYKTRFKKGLEDFIAWKKSPMQFKPSVIKKQKRPAGVRAEVVSENEIPNLTILPPSSSASPAPSYPRSVSQDAHPVKIRDGVTVYILNLPHDLTEDEAEKIGRIIKAHAQ